MGVFANKLQTPQQHLAFVSMDRTGITMGPSKEIIPPDGAISPGTGYAKIGEVATAIGHSTELSHVFKLFGSRHATRKLGHG